MQWSGPSFPAAFCRPAVLTYGSGLAFQGNAADGALEFHGLTDRGPNGDGPKIPRTLLAAGASDAKFFPSSSLVPLIGIISVGLQGEEPLNDAMRHVAGSKTDFS